MTEEIDRDIERELAELTAWRRGETAIWKSALAMSDGPRGRGRWVVRPWPLAAAAAIVIVVIAAIVSGQLTRNSGIGSFPRADASREQPGRTSAKMIGARSEPPTAPNPQLDECWTWTGDGQKPTRAGADAPGDFYAEAAEAYEPDSGGIVNLGGGGGGGASAAASDRHVVRRATMELATPDVRAIYEKAMQLASTARGEYVQNASIGGDEEHPWAQLTLRVAAERLEEVLNRLRGLGVVRSEQSEGDDVTTQVVDLEARLRNERRIEQELLELMDGREKDPIKDILELRLQMGIVRQTIESLEAQRQHLERLVSLATVLVIIRPDTEDERAVSDPQSIGSYFADSVARAWRGGLVFLADTVAGLIRIIVGGLVWWIGAVAVVVMAYRAWRRHRLFGSA